MSIIRKDLGPRTPARLKSKLSVVRPGRAVPDVRLELKTGGEFSLYSTPPEELERAFDRLVFRSSETNVFQAAPFLLTALKNGLHGLRLALIHEGAQGMEQDDLAALMAFRVEDGGRWITAHGFGDGTAAYNAPLISRHRPMATIDQLFEALANNLTNLPGIAVLPDLLADGAIMRLGRAVAAARGLAFRVTGATRRRALTARVDPSSRLAGSERAAWQDKLEKWQALQQKGHVTYRVARNSDEIEPVLEALPMLARDTAGPAPNAFLTAACRALAKRDWIRLHALYLDEILIAVAVQPVVAGEAWIADTIVHTDLADMAVDEQLIVRLTEWNLRDTNIRVTRCAPGVGPFLAERFWSDDEGRATLMVALKPGHERSLDAAAKALEV
ncbi:GNAT family N-acetyltransferase [Martelella mediterranea]|uniref:CelD/BcsL family acetyltransferase involved in cellulose biosynthesis n=1 Tax=Martelella mediterranea TaxID=293089 RepID=A0A4R3P2P5_9HYPH|nr:GNAT family N-acetyltransferase [Martelella mediterranea]TCT41765.1 CelD/BcsL family acetyltransferase involved in cellulose biosynthesis [Martelella mediterranea]